MPKSYSVVQVLMSHQSQQQPNFVPKIKRRNICARDFFFSRYTSTFHLAIFDGFFFYKQKIVVLRSKYKKIHLRSFFVKLRGSKDSQLESIKARYISCYSRFSGDLIPVLNLSNMNKGELFNLFITSL